jgi:hypothetical protein
MARDRTVQAWRLWLTVLGDLPGSVLREIAVASSLV